MEAAVCLVALQFIDSEPAVSRSELDALGKTIERVFRRVSREKLILHVRAAVCKVELPRSPASVGVAERHVLATFPRYRAYAIINGVLPGNHAGRRVAHLYGGLPHVCVHELGHLWGLQHAGKILEDGTLDVYGDGLSFMGRFDSLDLVAPQLDHLEWLPRVAVFDAAEMRRPLIRALRRIALYGSLPYESDHVVDAIKVTSTKSGLDAYVSFVNFRGGALALHLRRGGSSRRVKLFGNEYYDTKYTGVRVRRIQMENDDTWTVAVDVPQSLEDERADEADQCACPFESGPENASEQERIAEERLRKLEDMV